MASQKVVVIGAGPGGLAIAMLLAKAGLEVDVFERLPKVGGRTSAIEVDGFRFDCGPTFFLYPRVLEELFAAVGHDLWAEVPMARLDPQYRILFGDEGHIDATGDLERMQREVGRMRPEDAAGVEGFMGENRAKLELFRPCLENPFLSWRDVVTPRMLKLLPVLRPWQSLDQELARYFSDPRMRLVFSFQSKYLGMSPYRCPSLFSILSFLEYEYGVYHPIGGCNRIPIKMAEIAESLGARIHLDEPVESLQFEGRKAVGVVTASGAHPCDALVINADFSRAMTRLVPAHLRKRWSDRKIAKTQYSCSTFMMYLGIEGSVDHLIHHNIFVPNTYRSNLEDIETNHVLSDDPPFYVQNASVTDSTLAPPGMSTLYVLVPVTHQHANVDWSVETPRMRAQTLRQMREQLGITDIERRIRVERILTPADWDAKLEIHLGATFNMAHNLGQMLHLRPRNRFEDLEKVYLVGGGTHPGSGLPVIFESSRITAGLLLNDLGRGSEWLHPSPSLPSAQPAGV